MHGQHPVARLGDSRLEPRVIESEIADAAAEVFRQVRGIVPGNLLDGLIHLRFDHVRGEVNALIARKG